MEGLRQRENDRLRPGDLAGAMAWWRDAGVDLDFTDEPQGWLAAPEAPPGHEIKSAAAPARPAPEPAPPARIGGDPQAWPADLAAFREWWLAEPLLDGGSLRGRVPPRGSAEAQVMIVVGQPEAEDEGELLSASQGRLLSAMLAAMSLPPEAVYLASALPRHTPVPDWADLAARGLGAVLRHHIALARPRRLLVFGEGVLSLLGNDPAQSAQNSSHFYHEDQTLPLLGARELASLARPAWKARFWRDWLDWTGTETA
ncbi:uracil-DNA glycosylase family protein [Novosphingobium bradum]|uniref:Uracil-DNA glycosylase family protein n=2 Tax=Novosphingobium bradum TaxID=1737444 RepID=A0ABV7IND3_9SPHN